MNTVSTTYKLSFYEFENEIYSSFFFFYRNKIKTVYLQYIIVIHYNLSFFSGTDCFKYVQTFETL